MPGGHYCYGAGSSFPLVFYILFAHLFAVRSLRLVGAKKYKILNGARSSFPLVFYFLFAHLLYILFELVDAKI